HRRSGADALESQDGLAGQPPLAGKGLERRAQPLGAERIVGGVRLQADRSRDALLMGGLRFGVTVEKLPFAAPFRIAGYVFEHMDAVIVTLEDGTHRGRGEAEGVFYLQDDAPQMLEALEACRPSVEAGIDREALQRLLPPGGARNALDCALWELESRRSGRPVW